MTDRKLRVFLCHASQDKLIVRELYQRLLAEGWIDPWLDEEKILPGQDWDMEIRQAVRAADAVIVFLSNQSVLKEGYIQKELRFVLDVADEKPEGIVFAVPVRLDECSIPRKLENWHYLDYFPKNLQNRSYGRLLNTLTLKATFLGINSHTVIEGNLQASRLRVLLEDMGMISLTTLLDTQAAFNGIAEATGRILKARFVVIFTLDQTGNIGRTAHTGIAPKILDYLTQGPDVNLLIQAAMSLSQVSRIRNVTNLDINIPLDDHGLQSLVIIPLRLHRLAIGSILAFGKDGGTSFSEDDEFLASFISIQAGAAIEASWLYAELRTTLEASSAAYQLSQEILEVEGLDEAVNAIVRAAQKVSHADSGGFVVFNTRSEVETCVEFDSNGIRSESNYPLEPVEQALRTKQSIIVSTEQGADIYYPLHTPYRRYGALWLHVSESRGQNFANLQTLAFQASISIERLVLIREASQ